MMKSPADAMRCAGPAMPALRSTHESPVRQARLAHDDFERGLWYIHPWPVGDTGLRHELCGNHFGWHVATPVAFAAEVQLRLSQVNELD